MTPDEDDAQGRIRVRPDLVWFQGEQRRAVEIRQIKAVLVGLTLAVAALFVAPLVGGALLLVLLLYGVALFVGGWSSVYEVQAGVLRGGGELLPAGDVRLTGWVNGWQHVHVGEELVFRARPAGDDPTGLTVATLTRFGHVLAERLGVDVIDERPLEDLEAWERDPVVRECSRLQWAVEASRGRRPELFEGDPEEPRGEGDLGRMTWFVDGRGLMVDAAEVEGVPWADIDAFAVIDDGAGRRLQLVARTGGTREVLLETDAEPAFAAQLRWLEERLSGRVTRDHGHVDEVPRALAALAQRSSRGHA